MSIQRFPAVNNSGSSEALFKGSWNADTNTPALANTDNVTAGTNYYVSDAGTVNLGAGNITFEVGDIVINNGTVWSRIDATDAVVSVAGKSGIVTLDADDISEGTTNKVFTNTLKTKLDALTPQVTEIKTSNYTIVSGDKGKLIIADHSANPQQITMGTGLGWNVGDSITILNGSSIRDLQITKSGWIYWNDVSANITLKPYQGIKITNVATDYYLTQTFNALTTDYITKLDALLDPIKYVTWEKNEQTLSSTSYQRITGTTVTLSGYSSNLIKMKSVITLELVTIPTNIKLAIKPSNAYGNFREVRGLSIRNDGTESKIKDLADLGNYPDLELPESEIDLDLTGASSGHRFYIEYSWLQRQPSNGTYGIALKLVGAGSVKILNAYSTALNLGKY